MTSVGDVLDALAQRTAPGPTRAEHRPPRLSVGLAVHNGEDYLAEAIESILGQTYTDFELIISDNASTDATPAICAAFAARDPRIRLCRNEINIGGVNNENLTFLLSRGEYFRLAAHDDVCEPALFERCVEALDADPAVVLAYTGTTAIDEHGRVTGVTRLRKGTADEPWRRFGDFPFRDHHAETTYGVMRASAVRRARPQGSYGHADRVWLSELALLGRFVEIDDALFRKRYHPKNAYIDIRSRVAWFHPGRRGAVTLPYWLELGGYLGAVGHAPVSLTAKALCLRTVAAWAARYSPNLAKDVAIALAAHLRPGADRAGRADRRRYNWE